MPLQPFRRLSPALGAGEVARVAQDFQGIKTNQLLNIGRQKELDEFDKNAPVREASREGQLDAFTAQSLVDGAKAALPFIQANDLQGLTNSLQQRRQIIVERGGDTRHTDEILNKIQSGDPQQIQQAAQIITQVAGVGAGEDFTLAEGAQRRDAAGNLIAENPKAPAAGPKLSNPYAGSDEQGPGFFRTDQETGESVRVPGANPPVSGSGGESAREEEVRDFMNTFNLDRQDALSLQSGQAEIVTDANGRQTFVNAITQETKVIEPTRPNLTQVQTPQDQTIYAAAREGTGIWNSITRGAASVGAPLGADIGFAEDEIKAKQLLDSETRSMQRAFALSDKYAVKEQEIILKQSGLLATIGEDPAAFEQRAISIEGFVARAVAQAERDSRLTSDPAVRADAERIARDMRRYMNTLGVPLVKKEDIRSFAQAQEGFFDMTVEQQDRFIELKSQQAIYGKQ